jgi:hypothetical protein
MTDETNGTDHPMSGNEITIVSMLLTQLTVMEQRLLTQMSVNAEAAKTRWKSHDEQHDEWEKALKAIGHRLDDHLAKAREDALVMDARYGPIRRIGLWVVREWRTLVIVGLLLLDGMTQVSSILNALWPR